MGGKSSSASQTRSCAEHDVEWSFFDKFGYTKFHCGNEHPVLAWAEFSDEACQTRSDKGVNYEADGACYSLEGVENWVGDGMNSKKATCSDGKVAWVSYASPDCSGSVVDTSELAPVACSFSSFRDAHVKLVDGECDFATKHRTTFGAFLAFVLTLAHF